MNEDNKKNTIIGILIALILLTVIQKKKKPVPSVEVGKGEFGEFDTEGDFLPNDGDLGASAFSSPTFDNSSILKPIYNSGNGKTSDCGC